MPATEQTWRQQKTLHVVFAVSSVVMLISTLWMFGEDHNREWKTYQRTENKIEQKMTEWRLVQEQSESNRQEHERLQAALVVARSKAPAGDLYTQFQQAVQEDAARRDASAYQFDALDDVYRTLEELSRTAQGKREQATAFQEALRAATSAEYEAQQALLAAKQSGASADDLNSAEATCDAARQALATAQAAASQAENEAVAAETAAGESRGDLLGRLTGILRSARFREETLLGKRKFKAADYDAARAAVGLSVRDARPQEFQDSLQASVTDLKEVLDGLTDQYQDASTHRKKLQGILDQITQDEKQLEGKLADNRAEFDRLTKTLAERDRTYFTASPPFLGKRILELPILDAFNSPLKIDNLWTDKLTIPNGSFGQVRRFDRCTTCHQAMQRTMPGSATEPAYVHEHTVELLLSAPAQRPGSPPGSDQPGDGALTLEGVYGITLADEGLVNRDDVTVSFVHPGSLAAEAIAQVGPEGTSYRDGFMVGDVIEAVNADKVLSNRDARQFLLDNSRWGQKVRVTVRRGLPNPYTTHPRLDLFVGSLSPHKMSVMGCTICHEGQGSATDFKWASHAPNDPDQQARWARRYGWFNNPHWIYPMNPKRFLESSCLKCHHEVYELEPSEQFPEPPAPKLLAGLQLILDFGCFGCHEISGYNGDERIGPDLRVEPNFFAAAARVKGDDNFSKLSPEQQEWVNTLILDPERDDLRRSLRDFLREDQKAEKPQLSASSHKMAELLQDVAKPGLLPKAGPSLRYVGSKLGAPFLYDWIHRPKDFRPSTTMPQFFGLWSHLDGHDLEVAEKYEPVEIVSIVRYLLDNSQPWQYAEPQPGITASRHDDQVARGKQLFEFRGCLACHKHKDFPDGKATHGPDLSNVGDKFTAEAKAPNGRAWLYSWLRSPSNYHPRTVMPNLILAPITHADGSTTDPAADIAEFLLSSRGEWKPSEATWEHLQPNEDALRALALEHLSKTFFKRQAEQYLEQGIPESMREELKGAEVDLIGAVTQDKILQYVGAKTITKYGCFGCHDIPGFEDAKPIGTSLADWGRKETSKLAFEQIVQYLHHHDAEGADGHGGATSQEASGERVEEDTDFDTSFYREKIEEHDRIGFIWQKLSEPRSYDYKTTANKDYNDRLRMPRFPLTNEQREAIITFVLGLVSEPPATEFVYHPDARQHAIAQGREVLAKYNCAGCHLLGPEKWRIEFAPGEFRPQAETQTYPFLAHHYTPEELAKSATVDPLRKVVTATIAGMPSRSDDNGRPVVLDEEGDPIEEDVQYDPNTLQYRFDLWQPALVDGRPFTVGGGALTVPATMIKHKYPPQGGDLARLLLPRAVELEKQTNPSAKGSEAWGWLPPPLIGEGLKVQPNWLHDFLLDPHEIRPATLLRMPKFNLSPDEATKLVNYFAARDNANYPFEFDQRTRDDYLQIAEHRYLELIEQLPPGARTQGAARLSDAMNIVTDRNYCIQCHRVGDFEPSGSDRAKAPDLSQVYDRMRPRFVRNWVAFPQRILPYTGMPVNIPYDPNAPNLGGVNQDLFHGTSIEQLDAVVDLLMNFNVYTRLRSPVAPLVKEAPAGQVAGGQASASGEASTGN